MSITGLNVVPTVQPTLVMTYLDGGQSERTSAGSSTYLNSSEGIASETTSGGTTYYTRTPGGHLVSQRTPTATYYYLFDGLGSVVGMVDGSGTLVARYGYDPYGQTVVKTGTAADGNPFRYAGAYLDSTGLYKMGARYYDAARGRFTQLDPLGNGYGYASENPVNLIDPSGLFAGWAGGLNDGNDPGGPVSTTIGGIGAVQRGNGDIDIVIALAPGYSPDVNTDATLSYVETTSRGFWIFTRTESQTGSQIIDPTEWSVDENGVASVYLKIPAEDVVSNADYIITFNGIVGPSGSSVNYEITVGAYPVHTR